MGYKPRSRRERNLETKNQGSRRDSTLTPPPPTNSGGPEGGPWSATAGILPRRPARGSRRYPSPAAVLLVLKSKRCCEQFGFNFIFAALITEPLGSPPPATGPRLPYPVALLEAAAGTHPLFLCHRSRVRAAAVVSGFFYFLFAAIRACFVSLCLFLWNFVQKTERKDSA